MSFLNYYTGLGLAAGVLFLAIRMILAGGPDGMTADWISEEAPKLASAILKMSMAFTAICLGLRFTSPDTAWQRLRRQLLDLGWGGVVEGGLVMIWIGTICGVAAVVSSLAIAWMWGRT